METGNGSRVARHARVLAEYSAAVQRGETVAIVTTTEAMELLEPLYACLLELGAYPTPFVSVPRLEEIFLRLANEDQLGRPGFFMDKALDHFDHVIRIGAPENTRFAASTDPRRQALQAEGNRAVMEKWMAKLMQPENGVTITQHPTAAYAQDAGMSLLDYEDFFYSACLLDGDDPTARWREMSERQTRIADWLGQRSKLKFEGPHIDLSMSVAGRTWLSDDGHKNFPGGEIFTSPVEDTTDGHVHFTFPSFNGGREVRDVELWFEGGSVIRSSATLGEAYLTEMLNIDEGARRLGEIAIGTNYGVTRTTGSTLLDEKIGGSCHMAIGRGFPNLGSRNMSAVHWDMVCDLRTESTISADGEVFYRNGEFVLP